MTLNLNLTRRGEIVRTDTRTHFRIIRNSELYLQSVTHPLLDLIVLIYEILRKVRETRSVEFI